MFEPSEIARYERELIAMLRKAGRDDPEAFAQVVAVLETALSVTARESVRDLRAQGFSWRDLSQALGVTRQAPRLRWAL